MASSAYVLRQAQEVFKTALEKKELNRWQSDLRRIASLVKDTALLTLLDNPEVRFDDKAKVLSERLGDINPEALKFVSELVAKGRLSETGEIADVAYKRFSPAHGYWMVPSVPSIVDKMEAIYKRLKEDKKGQIAKDCRSWVVKNYNIDTLFKDKWVPYLEKLQDEILTAKGKSGSIVRTR